MSSRLGVGPITGVEVLCRACDHIVSMAGTREDAILDLLSHYQDAHPHSAPFTTNPVVMLEAKSSDEPGDFEIHPLPYRCDLCGETAGPPCWTYVTPPSRSYRVEDPEWLICDGCRPLVQARDIVGLISRAIAVNERVFGVPPPITREKGREVILPFLNNYDPALTRRDSA